VVSVLCRDTHCRRIDHISNAFDLCE
jgi:hypothetical protein